MAKSGKAGAGFRFYYEYLLLVISTFNPVAYDRQQEPGVCQLSEP